jgi:outer membrane protein OmpA-like peptidoglycan-associated protein
MSFNIRILLLLLAWLVYVVFLVRACSDDICTACFPGSGVGKDIPGAPDSTTAIMGNPFPIGFKWSEIQPDRGPGFDSLMRAVREGQDSNKILEITGRYFDGETKPADHETMGLARAAKIRDLYFTDFPEEKISLRSRTMEESQATREQYFEAIIFGWVAPAAGVQELEELEDRMIIRFPANSTEKEYDPMVDDYLRKLAQRVVRSGEKIEITGHTDNTGKGSNNLTLGKNRADQIRKILLKSGVPEDQISIASKGESQPVAPNSTASGRQNNRRAEVRLLKKP